MTVRKRVNVVSLQLIKESSFLYKPRKCSSPEDAYELFSQFIEKKATEHLVVACLNTKGEVVNISTVHIGSVNQSLAVPREIVKTALLCNAVNIIVAHNHPSNSTEPSREDRRFTKNLLDACQLLQIGLRDHIIIAADGNYSSMRRDGVFAEFI